MTSAQDQGAHKPTAAAAEDYPQPTAPRADTSWYLTYFGVVSVLGFVAVGLVNNFSYVVLISAAEDINHAAGVNLGVGTVLLSSVLPGTLFSLLFVWVMHFIPYGVRFAASSAVGFTGMVVVALAPSITFKLVGVAISSLQSAIGELSWLSYSSRYCRYPVVSAWSAGTGAAGLFGALVYFVLTTVLLLSPQTSLLIVSPVSLMLILLYLYPLRLGDPYDGARSESPSTSEGLVPTGSLARSVAESQPDLAGATIVPGETHDLHTRRSQAGPQEGPGSSSGPLLATSPPRPVQPGPDALLVTPISPGNEHRSHGSDPGQYCDEDAAHARRRRRGFQMRVLPARPMKSPVVVEPGARITLWQRVAILRGTLFPATLPLFLVYLSEYLIGAAVFPVIVYRHATLDRFAQYRLWSLLYQAGVLVSRSSGELFPVGHVWVFSVLQALNFVVLFVHALVFLIPTLWLMSIMVFWVGLMGGSVYVNAFRRLHKELEPRNVAEAALGLGQIGITFGILLAAGLGIPLQFWLETHASPKAFGV